MTAAGELRDRIAFDKRISVNDGRGNVQGVFEQQFIVAAKVRARFGGETFAAARLAGEQPVTITVRQSSQTRLIADDWRARDLRTGVEYAIASIADPDGGRTWLEILVKTGAAP